MISVYIKKMVDRYVGKQVLMCLSIALHKKYVGRGQQRGEGGDRMRGDPTQNIKEVL